METSAPAKIILLGEHAVVYGCPAIAVPVSSLRVTASVVYNQPSGLGLRIVAGGQNQTAPVEIIWTETRDDAIARAVRLFLDALDAAAPDVTISLDSQIPVASGLGSGAAITAALGRGLAAAVNKELPDSVLNDVVYEVEKMYHGTPSGIDNTVIVYERPVYFVRGKPIETLIIGAPLEFLVADTGQSALTRVAVADVRRLYDAAPEHTQGLFDAIAALVKRARQSIEEGDAHALGLLMNENHRLLQQLTVSSPQLDRLVQVALDAGALGAKLSGGGRGGNMVALVAAESSRKVGQALDYAGAARVFQTVVGQEKER